MIFKDFKLLGDIGGILGLFLGFSVMTILEFVETLLDLLVLSFIRLCCKKCFKERRSPSAKRLLVSEFSDGHTDIPMRHIHHNQPDSRSPTHNTHSLFGPQSTNNVGSSKSNMRHTTSKQLGHGSTNRIGSSKSTMRSTSHLRPGPRSFNASVSPTGTIYEEDIQVAMPRHSGLHLTPVEIRNDADQLIFV